MKGYELKWRIIRDCLFIFLVCLIPLLYVAHKLDTMNHWLVNLYLKLHGIQFPEGKHNNATVNRLRNAAKDVRMGKDLDLPEDEFEVFHTIRNDGIAEGYRVAQHK